jgi:chromosome partitioning protein
MAGQVIVVGCEKGGVGKTTLAVQLASEFAQRRGRVLVIDNDPSGDATTALCGNDIPDSIRLGTSPEGISSTIKLYTPDVEVQPHKLDDNLYLIGATEDLSMFGGSSMEPMYEFNQAIQSLIEQFDYIFIDCPPSFSVPFSSALFSCHSGGVLIPVLADELSFRAAKKVIKRVGQMIEMTKNPTPILGIIANRIDTNPVPQSVKYYLNEMNTEFGELLFEVTINKAVQITDATSLSLKVSKHGKSNSKAAKQIRLAADELFTRLKG